MIFLDVAFVIRRDCPRCASIVRRILDIVPADWNLIFENEVARFIGKKGVPLDSVKADIIVTIGGDGTVLRTLQRAHGPVLGINMGGLGFLSEVELGMVENTIYKLERKEYRIEKSIKLKVTLNGMRQMDCTNEVLIHSDRIAKIRRFGIYTSDNFIDLVAADGVIVATPVGSTSYSFSAGGPIIYPTLDAAVITYLAPFISGSRSIVIPPDQEINIRILGKDQDCTLVLDGQENVKVSQADDIRVSLSENKAEFVNVGRTFFERMRDKLIKNVVD